jgi:1-acyl-sn-glycerol-3-phosphate acyltransferase
MSALPADPAPLPAGAHVLVTGCTGFIGKVVLAELVRRRDELGIRRIDVLIRSKRGQDPAARFAAMIASPCFRQLEPGWQAICRPVAGDITQPHFGIAGDERAELTASLTQLIHCAASVDFDLPLAEAAGYNITGALGALGLAKQCPQLQAFVDVSTAYVWPHPGGDRQFGERLVPLDIDAAATYAAIQAGTFDEKALLARTGHANTYTFTKCLAERLLAERQGGVPLVILRPSIVSACWEHPFAGWIDSKAAFAGFVALFGLGHLRVLGADTTAYLDLVPCDAVAARIIRAAFDPATPRRDEPAIRFAVAGKAHAAMIGQIADWGTPYFQRFPAGRSPGFRYTGPRNLRFHLGEWWRHRLPAAAARIGATAIGQQRLARQARKLGEVLVYLNRGFRYFMTRTYDFQASWPLAETGFSAERYLHAVFRGVNRNLLDVDETALAIGGKEAKALARDLPWALQGPGNGTLRTFAFGLRRVFRQACSVVTVDVPSFQAAMARVAPDSRVVIVPSHRSYLDFLVLPYLFFSKPWLGIDMPHIASTDTFAKLPVIGGLLRQAQAFYIRRGVGREDPALTRAVDELLGSGRVLKFFIEGTRSRSRRFMPARRGLLRAIQAAGHPVTILPVAVSYDRVPEERAILAELRGAGKPREGLSALVGWFRALRRGEIRLGRVHVACGQPLVLDAQTDVPLLAERIVAELQRATTVSTFHLNSFAAVHPAVGVTAAEVQTLLEARGARVLPGLTVAHDALDPLVLRSLEQQWLPWFYPDLLAWLPDHPVVRQQAHCFGPGMIGIAAGVPDEKLQGLLTALMAPICRDYAAVARYLGERLGQTASWRLNDLHRALPEVFRPDLEAVLADLTARGIVVEALGDYHWGPEGAQILAYAPACEWPDGNHSSPAARMATSPATQGKDHPFV